MAAAKRGRESPLLLLVLHLVAVSQVVPMVVQSRCIIFNFGDSNSDTGGLEAGVGFPMGPPHGYLFFGRSAGRWSDGRLYIDFLCQSLHMTFLSPYMEALGSDFTFGANFAVAGAMTQPKAVPFSLYIQVQQFQHFKNRTREFIDQAGARHLIQEEEFQKAMYFIDIGQNDISTAFYSNMSYAQVVDSIPPVLSEIEAAIETLYASGARKFLVYNTGPFGCFPQTLARNNKDNSDLDPHGCLMTFNNAAKAFNAGLRALCDELRSKLKDAILVHVDMYAIKYDLVANHTKYGFERPLMACCGYGGPPYNYKVRLTCGQPNTNICNKGSRFISWDGVHYTEDANAIVSSKILSTDYSTPPVKLDHLCKA